MRATVLSLIALTGLLIPGGAALAHGNHDSTTVTPAREQRPAPRDAPSTTQKVSVESLGSLDLSREFAAMQGPGAAHQADHDCSRWISGLASASATTRGCYMIHGSLVEIRDDGTGPRAIQRKAGEAVFESTGVLHGWRNDSDQSATAVVIDMVPQTQP